MITPKRIFLLLALGACLATAACGSDDEKGSPIPEEQATALLGRLDEAENRLANGSEGACKDILDDTMPEVGKIIDSLPSSVDPDVRDALEESFDNLWSLVDSECQELKSDEPAPTTPTETETTETLEIPTETETAPPETDTETAPEDETIPPDGDGDSDGVIPEGNGGGVGPGAAKAKDKVKG